ncbi:MAG TPA: CBM20 domain-containing protein, partial [Candidatus Limnocylindria bacterium]
NTPPGDTLYIAGDFQGWDPGGTPMTRVDALTWEITLTFTENAAPQYKFTRGSWDAVEKDDGCGEIPNRTFTVVFGTDGTGTLDLEVAKWRDIDLCG